MQPVYRIDKSVGLFNHSSCLKAFCPKCDSYLGEYDLRDCKCGGWYNVNGEYEIKEKHNRSEKSMGELVRLK